MTSKRCFFKLLREDIRHKTWMLALSVIGNLLALPVTFLLSTGSRTVYSSAYINVESLIDGMYQLEEFFVGTMCITGGIIAIVGAFIVGLFGFRFVFHRNMADTYHSIPVKRRTLFLAGWLNGFLIWFLPFLANLIVTVVLGESRLGSLKRAAEALQGVSAADRELLGTRMISGGGLILNALLSALALMLAFFLIYHLVLLAVMLCGNVLNTLVSTALLGGGILSVYGIFFLFQVDYLDTFLIAAHVGYEKLVYASPLVSSIYILYQRAVLFAETGSFAGAAAVNLLIAAAMGALALLAYLKRPSELAEQGIFCKPVRVVQQSAASLAAAMGGWILFHLLSRGIMGAVSGTAWCVFGALLAGIVTCGVLDIIFHMDFKAFFAHKIWMAVLMGVSLLICFSFAYDWMGYDSYLPEEEKIAEIAVYDYGLTNVSAYDVDLRDENHPLRQVHITDQAAAYAFLKNAVDFLENGFPEDYVEQENSYNSESIYVKVTLKSGRSYYRTYLVNGYVADSACALLELPEYLNANFRLSDEVIADFSGGNIRRNDMSCGLEDTEEDRAVISEICRAYNKDLEESPDIFIHGGGRLLCTVSLEREQSYTGKRYLEIYEEMHHTVEALCRLGLEDFVEPMDAEELQEIVLSLNYWYSSVQEGFNIVKTACDIYGVYPEGMDVSGYELEISDLPASQTETDFAVNTYSDEEIALHITDAEEIESLLKLVSYQGKRHDSGIFQPTQVDNITLVCEDGRIYNVYIPRGALPEKYILEFAKLQEKLLQPAE